MRPAGLRPVSTPMIESPTFYKGWRLKPMSATTRVENAEPDFRSRPCTAAGRRRGCDRRLKLVGTLALVASIGSG
jgi:hypothetical protein